MRNLILTSLALFAASSAFAGKHTAPPAHLKAGDQVQYVDIKETKGSVGKFNFDYLYPELNSKFTDEKIRKKINQVVLALIESEKPSSPSETTENQKSSSIVLLNLVNPVALSITLDFENDAYAMGSGESFAFDLSTGEKIDLDSQIEPKQKEAFFKMVKAEFRKQISKDDDRDCKSAWGEFDENSKNNSVRTPWVLKQDSVYFVQSDLPQAFRACGLELSLPFTQMKPYLKVNSIFDRIIQARPAGTPSPSPKPKQH